jgi:2-keto-3-deoxy-L-rhamnonate aldolase RhmA
MRHLGFHELTVHRPFDLAFSLGVKPGSEEHEAAIAKILAACKKAGKVAAIFCRMSPPPHPHSC